MTTSRAVASLSSALVRVAGHRIRQAYTVSVPPAVRRPDWPARRRTRRTRRASSPVRPVITAGPWTSARGQRSNRTDLRGWRAVLCIPDAARRTGTHVRTAASLQTSPIVYGGASVIRTGVATRLSRSPAPWKPRFRGASTRLEWRPSTNDPVSGKLGVSLGCVHAAARGAGNADAE